MDTTTEFAVHTGDRCTAMEVAAAALRRTGHHVESTGGTMTATAGSRTLTILLGALVQPAREYRRYELSTVVDGASLPASMTVVASALPSAGSTWKSPSRLEHAELANDSAPSASTAATRRA